MNLKLCSILKDITGVTGMKIFRSIVSGERDATKISQFRDPNCHKSEEEIAKSLEGYYKSEYLASFIFQLTLLTFFWDLN